MSDQIRTLLLLALPASGKSELRRLLSTLTPDQLRELHLGPLVQIDDFPYVELMREIDRLMSDIFHYGPIFFTAPERPFRNPKEWLTLIHLLDQDRDRLVHRSMIEGTENLGYSLLQRIIDAQASAKSGDDLARLPYDVLCLLGKHLQERAVELYRRVFSQKLEDNSTLVIEFARGGPHGATLPLRSDAAGYAGSLPQLSHSILSSASVLYVQVEPEQARARNFERAVPPPGRESDTTTFHGVPLSVMLHDYGCDDFRHVAGVPVSKTSDDVKHNAGPIHVRTETGGGQKTYTLPTAVFDNRGDVTTPLRAAPSAWSVDDFNNAYRPLKDALDRLHAAQWSRTVKS